MVFLRVFLGAQCPGYAVGTGGVVKWLGNIALTKWLFSELMELASLHGCVGQQCLPWFCANCGLAQFDIKLWIWYFLTISHKWWSYKWEWQCLDADASAASEQKELLSHKGLSEWALELGGLALVLDGSDFCVFLMVEGHVACLSCSLSTVEIISASLEWLLQGQELWVSTGLGYIQMPLDLFIQWK